MKYSTTQLADHFGVSRTTVITWTNVFSDYLSDNTRPAEGNKRTYDENDMRLLAIVKSMLDERLQYDEILASLGNANLDKINDVLEIMPALSPDDSLQQAMIRIDDLNSEIQAVIAERDAMRNEMQQAVGESKMLERFYREAQARIIELERQLAILEAGDDES